MDYRDLEDLYDQHGGKFRLAVLLQKRVQMLVQGDKRLVDAKTDNPIDVAIAEVRSGKIWLAENEEVATE